MTLAYKRMIQTLFVRVGPKQAEKYEKHSNFNTIKNYSESIDVKYYI